MRALEGIKVVDFSWVGVGPWTVRHLAHHGAIVIHVETSRAVDVLRLTPPFKGGKTDINKAAYFALYNSNKYGMTLNLNHPKARDVAIKLIKWADILVESFTPGTMKRWGLSYEDVVKIKEDIIYFSTCQMGQTGPRATHPAFGTQLVSYSGFTYLTGWPDRGPTGPYGPYTDTIAPHFGVSLIVAALMYRERTGKGVHIDLSQLEASLQFIGPLLVEFFLSGEVQGRMGNRDPQACPHGAFRCRGDDRWIFIEVWNDEEWEALKRVMGNPDWAEEERFRTFMGRKRNEDELERLIEAWTITKDAYALMEELQREGVPAGVVQKGEDLLKDPRLRSLPYYWEIEHPEIGKHIYEGPPYTMSKTPPKVNMPAPLLGQHTEFVCTKILGIPDEEFISLFEEGVFE